jgi:hypothetical protein
MAMQQAKHSIQVTAKQQQYAQRYKRGRLQERNRQMPNPGTPNSKAAGNQ